MTGVDGNPYLLLKVDGAFGPPQIGYGPGVYVACKALQWEMEFSYGHNLGPSGIDGRWGGYTCKALQGHLSRPETGSWNSGDTTALQQRCGYCGFPTTVDGQFGRLTAEALELSLNSDRF